MYVLVLFFLSVILALAGLVIMNYYPDLAGRFSSIYIIYFSLLLVLFGYSFLYLVAYSRIVLNGNESNIITQKFNEEQYFRSKELFPQLREVELNWRMNNKKALGLLLDDKRAYKKLLAKHFRYHFCFRGGFTVTAMKFALKEYFENYP